ncbi:cytochrome P450 [Lentithecium fluviatile CBS 122367]|uniref:Cytochrome P450 n=1 Tax=Lentithecium fluviatile CBS 122367 TaxID=1168545 RepID=A0A6G1ITG5_9PLEO|nr:cytochrome P450 [Lentithecium fluviatile CBS 122367]
MDLTSKLVYYISKRILVSPDLCRRADYCASTESLNMFHVIFGALWNFVPLGPFRRPFYWVFSIPYCIQIRRAMDKYIIPIVEERVARKDDANLQWHLDTIQLMVEMHPATPKGSVPTCHSYPTSMPECIEPICAEIKDVLAKYVVSLRVAQQPVTMHNGFQLKTGTRIVFLAQFIHLGPTNYESPHDFIPFHFAGPGPCECPVDGPSKEVGRLKADAPDEKYLPFGYGKQSCTGQFFALKVVKLILRRLIYEYDITATGPLPDSPTSGTMDGFFLSRIVEA